MRIDPRIHIYDAILLLRRQGYRVYRLGLEHLIIPPGGTEKVVSTYWLMQYAAQYNRRVE